VSVAELLKLLLGNVIGQPHRIVRSLRVTQAVQKVDEPLPLVCHEPHPGPVCPPFTTLDDTADRCRGRIRPGVKPSEAIIENWSREGMLSSCERNT